MSATERSRQLKYPTDGAAANTVTLQGLGLKGEAWGEECGGALWNHEGVDKVTVESFSLPSTVLELWSHSLKHPFDLKQIMYFFTQGVLTF